MGAMANQKETKGDRHFPSGLDSIEAEGCGDCHTLPPLSQFITGLGCFCHLDSIDIHRSLRVFKGIHHIRHIISSFSRSCALFGFMKALGQEPAHGTGGLYRNLPHNTPFCNVEW